jgi:hypothetical protein
MKEYKIAASRQSESLARESLFLRRDPAERLRTSA